MATDSRRVLLALGFFFFFLVGRLSRGKFDHFFGAGTSNLICWTLFEMMVNVPIIGGKKIKRNYEDFFFYFFIRSWKLSTRNLQMGENISMELILPLVQPFAYVLPFFFFFFYG